MACCIRGRTLLSVQLRWCFYSADGSNDACHDVYRYLVYQPSISGLSRPSGLWPCTCIQYYCKLKYTNIKQSKIMSSYLPTVSYCFVRLHMRQNRLPVVWMYSGASLKGHLPKHTSLVRSELFGSKYWECLWSSLSPKDSVMRRVLFGGRCVPIKGGGTTVQSGKTPCSLNTQARYRSRYSKSYSQLNRPGVKY